MNRSSNVLQYTTFAASTLKEIADIGKMHVLGTTATCGLAIVKALETGKSNREDTTLLLERVHKILCCIIQLDAVVPVDGAMSPSILFDIAKFADTLQRIMVVLNEQQAMGRLKQFFKQTEQTALLQACQTELHDSLQLFAAHCTRMNLTNIARIEMQTQEYHDQLLALLSENPSLTNSDISSWATKSQSMMTTSSLSLSMLPPRPQIFHGREEEVEKIMSTLRQTAAARIAILGTGGIGKTTLASSVIHHPEIASLFPGDQIYFVPCEGAPTAEELLATIAAHIGIERNSQIRRGTAVSGTPWEALGERTGVSKLLGQLAELKNLAIIITMRGAERPTGVKWTRPFLPLLLPISNDAALKTFLDIAGDPQEDEKSSVYDLLECTGNLPLAITLISSAAADEGCAATLARWHDTKTLVLSDGYDKRSSLDISISLSLTSAQMTKEALELLSLLAILPDGLGNAELTEALRGVMPNILGVKAVLLQTALAFIDASDRRLKLLVPIREYMAASHAPPAQLKAATWVYFQKLLSLWNDFDSVKLSAFLTSQITANVQNLITLTMGEMDSEENKGTEREADVLRAALWIDEFLFVSNHSKAAPWASSMRERIQPWRHHPVYIPYLDVVIQGKQYSEAEMDELIAEGNEYFQDKAVSERAKWYSRVANHYQIYRNDLRKAIEFRQMSVDTICTLPYPTTLTWHHLTSLSNNLLMAEDAQKAQLTARRAHEYALQLSPIVGPNNNAPIAVTLSVLGRSAMRLGDLPSAARYLRDSLAFFVGSYMEGMQAHITAQSNLSVMHARKTEYIEARLILQNSRPPLDPRHAPTLSRIFTGMNIALLDIKLGEDPEDLARRVDKMRLYLTTIPTQVAPIGFILLDMILGELKLYQGDRPHATRLLQTSFSKLFGTLNECSISCAQELADYDSRLGSLDVTFNWSVVVLAFASRIRDNLSKIQALRCLGKVFLAEGDYGNARVLLALALEDLTFLDVHHWRADCMMQLAQIRKQGGDVEGEVQFLRQAIPLFERSGQTKDVARAEALLLAAAKSAETQLVVQHV
ncbi:hypothetical protein C8F01DRAFT_1378894 [Mycena amicta]|nr:hypothetical protein C8F01DRAFT_1378894 [Mycena amicta]